MNKSIIVYGPQGCGKTVNAERIRKHFGLELVVDDFDGRRQPYQRKAFELVGVLYLTHLSKAEIAANLMMDPSQFRRLLSFAEVAKQINDAIPLTKWQSGPPPMVGEWIASKHENDSIRRYWDGICWSFGFKETDSQETKNNSASMSNDSLDVDSTKWRGLSEEPIIVRGA